MKKFKAHIVESKGKPVDEPKLTEIELDDVVFSQLSVPYIHFSLKNGDTARLFFHSGDEALSFYRELYGFLGDDEAWAASPEALKTIKRAQCFAIGRGVVILGF